MDEYRQQGRYGQGVRVMNITPERTGSIVAARVVSPKDEVTLISTGGILLRMSGAHISQQGRSSQGVRVMDLREGDAVASVAVIRETRQAVTAAEMNGQPAESETAEWAEPSADGTSVGPGNVK